MKTDEQSDARKSPVGREFESWFFGGDCVIASVMRCSRDDSAACLDWRPDRPSERIWFGVSF
jgi:hypothetical protein